MAILSPGISLPTINNLPVGVVKAYLYHDDSIVDLTYPTTVPFLNIREFVESLDKEAGVLEIENADLQIAEDYSVHSEGFWHKLINGNPSFNVEILFTVTESGTENYLFRGSVYRKECDMDELFLSPTSGTPTLWVRGVSLKLVSSVIALKNVRVADWITEIKTHLTTGYDGNYKYITLGDAIAYMLVLAFDLPDILYADITQNGKDIVPLTIADDLWINCFVEVQYKSGVIWYDDGLFDDGTVYPEIAYVARFETVFDVLKCWCKQFAAVPRYSYDVVGDTHAIVLNSRSGISGYVTPAGKVLNSVFKSEATYKAEKVRATDVRITGTTPNAQTFWYAGNVLQTTTPPQFEKFDIEIGVDFLCNNETARKWFGLYHDIGDVSEGYCSTVKYYDFGTGGYVTLNANNTVNKFGQAIAAHHHSKGVAVKTQYERDYDSIQATIGGSTTQNYMQVLRTTQISDGGTTRNYCALEVKKDIHTGRLKVTWVEL